MATPEEAQETQDITSEFNFDEWASSLGLSRKITQILRQEELVSKEALSLLELKDLKELNFPMGTTKIILHDIAKWTTVQTNVTDTVSVTEPNVQSSSMGNNFGQLEGAGKTLDHLLNDLQAPPAQGCPISSGQADWGHMDPRTILTIKAQSSKAVHITAFITEHCKRRRQNRRKEFIIKSGTKDTETLVLKSDDEHPYLGIYIEEWGAANMRLMNHLLCTGQLPRDEIEFYLAYTTKIYEFAEKYDWNSVLNYDYNYRELQAEHKFKWGTFSPHMELQLLVPKRPKQQSGQNGPGQLAREDCKLFKARGSCPFGATCKFRHLRSQQKDSKDSHAEASMPSKNSQTTGQQV